MLYQNYCQLLITEMELRGYSPRTVNSYSKHLLRFLTFTPLDREVSDFE